MNEQTKLVVARSLECRIAQCETQMQVISANPDAQFAQEHYSYWDGEKIAALNALASIHAAGFGA